MLFLFFFPSSRVDWHANVGPYHLTVIFWAHLWQTYCSRRFQELLSCCKRRDELWSFDLQVLIEPSLKVSRRYRCILILRVSHDFRQLRVQLLSCTEWTRLQGVVWLAFLHNHDLPSKHGFRSMLLAVLFLKTLQRQGQVPRGKSCQIISSNPWKWITEVPKLHLPRQMRRAIEGAFCHHLPPETPSSWDVKSLRKGRSVDLICLSTLRHLPSGELT